MYKGSPEFEFIVLSVNYSASPSPDICVALFYRPPGSDISLLDTLFSTLCDIMFVLVPHQLLLIGDFNIDYLIPASSLYFKLQSIVSSFNLTQVVSEPTRVCKTSETLIDLIFVSSSVFVRKSSATPPLANADHNGLHLSVSDSLNLPVKRSKPVTRNIWRYSLADFDRAAELLETVEWVSLLPTDNVDSYCSTWITYFLQIMEICIPHAVTKTKSNVPWMNRTIAEAIKKRNTLFRTAKRTGKLSDRVKYTVKRNQVVAMLRNSKQSFFDELNSADSKTFWKTVRLLNNQQSSVPTLQHNGIVIETASNKAAALNNFFTAVSTIPSAR